MTEPTLPDSDHDKNQIIDKRIQLKINAILLAIKELTEFKFKIEELIAKLSLFCNTEDKFYSAALADEVISIGETIQGLSKIIRPVSTQAFFKADSIKVYNSLEKEYKNTFKRERADKPKYDSSYNPKHNPKWLTWGKKYYKGDVWYNTPSDDYVKDYLTKTK
jgi:hypothetical protein